MEREAILGRLQSMIAEQLDLPPDEVAGRKTMVNDLVMDQIDLHDLELRIASKFDLPFKIQIDQANDCTVDQIADRLHATLAAQAMLAEAAPAAASMDAVP